MRLTILIGLFVLGFVVSAKNTTRGVQLEFENNGRVLSRENKEKILEMYIKTGPGDWIYFNTVQESEIEKNRHLAHSNAKIRNRIIADFLKENGIDGEQIKFKYGTFENLWVNKPLRLKSSVKLKNKEDSTNQIVKDFRNIDGCFLRFKSGNIIKFKPMSFEGSSTDVITVRIQEFNSKYDFVKYGVTALGDKGILETKGMYFIEAFSNDVKINLRPQVTYTLKINEAKSDVPFYSFYGKETNGQLTWVKNSQQKFYQESPEVNNDENELDEENYLNQNEITDTVFIELSSGEMQAVLVKHIVSEQDYLVGEYSDLGWINCDRFYDAEEKITMTFSIDNGICDNSFAVYLIFKDINSVLPIYKITNGVYQTPEIPKGSEVTLLALQTSKSQNKLAFLDFTTNDDNLVNVNSSNLTKEDLERYLRDVIF